MAVNDAASTVLTQFHDFYLKILTIKKNISVPFPVPDEESSVTPGDTGTSVRNDVGNNQQGSKDLTSESSSKDSPESEAFFSMTREVANISVDIASFLRDQKMQILASYGQYAEQYYQDAQYIMAAFADEFFLTLDWRGKTVWEQNLVEMNLFNSHVAGDLFFDRLDDYLQTTGGKTGRSMGALFYYVLSLGFQGKYRGQLGAEKIIHDYKLRLFLLITQHNPRLDDSTKKLYPKAYEHTITDGTEQKITDPKWWWGATFILVCAMLIVSHLLWDYATKDVLDVMDGILDHGLIQAHN